MKPIIITKIKNLRGKKVLVRVDLNCTVVKGRVIESDRIKAHAETLKYLKKKGAKVVVLAHQGEKGGKDLICLEQHARLLNKYVKIKFVDQVFGEKAWEAMNSLKNGDAILLDNVRFVKEEYEPSEDNGFVQFMKQENFDYFVQDAFSVCHRNQTSVVSFPRVITPTIGLVMEKELENAYKIKRKSKNALFILGGLKVKDVVSLIKYKNIIATGRVAFYGLTADGIDLGKESKEVLKDKENLKHVKDNIKNLILPSDLAVDFNGRRKDTDLGEFPVNRNIFDIGKNSANEFAAHILKLKSTDVVFYKGAPGNFETHGFDYGTKKILNALAKTKAYTILSGGSGSDALNKFGLRKKNFNYISLSGGALVRYIAGEKLPGLEALGL
ncbi:MAG: phosphoglycerate kinase [Nanoarchaeota archaeon]|nr:phosphoglycerate kinase [Nanoarchaeota archaeon]